MFHNAQESDGSDIRLNLLAEDCWDVCNFFIALNNGMIFREGEKKRLRNENQMINKAKPVSRVDPCGPVWKKRLPYNQCIRLVNDKKVEAWDIIKQLRDHMSCVLMPMAIHFSFLQQQKH